MNAEEKWNKIKGYGSEITCDGCGMTYDNNDIIRKDFNELRMYPLVEKNGHIVRNNPFLCGRCSEEIFSKYPILGLAEAK